MDEIEPEQDNTVDRRTFLKDGLVAGGLLAGAGLGITRLVGATEASRGKAPAPAKRRVPSSVRTNSPNILVILVDQMRYPQWLTLGLNGATLPPNLQRLRNGAVSFAGHYTASNDCTPARSTLLTGLYTHQTGCMITGGSTLDPGFATWGTMLRERGYSTRWYGKWHVTHRDNHWGQLRGERALARYGFGGGTYPSPDGAPGQGWRRDPHIASQFEQWLARDSGQRPWCTTVSFVNPHDIAWWYAWSDRVPAEISARRVAAGVPPNFETPELLMARNKPQLQRSLQSTAAAAFGPVPFTGPEAPRRWTEFLDLYAKLQFQVDRQIGRVLDALQRRPRVAENTVILFTSDHGEYGGSHGLRGKGAAAYEEGIRVPLIVKDLRGQLAAAPELTRQQLTSSVDVAALLLTIATGSDNWRAEEHYSQLAGRADLAAMLADPQAPGRPYVLHATDETVTEFAIEPYAATAPRHVVAVRTPTGKYASYSEWSDGGIEPLAQGAEHELYDYTTDSGALELHNSAGESAQEEAMRATLREAFAQELRQPLPTRLAPAQARGFADYFSTASAASEKAAAARLRRAERESGGVEGGLSPEEPLLQHLRASSPAKRR